MANTNNDIVLATEVEEVEEETNLERFLATNTLPDKALSDFHDFMDKLDVWDSEVEWMNMDYDKYEVAIWAAIEEMICEDESDSDSDIETDDDEQNASHDIVVYNLHVEGKDKKFITALQTALSDFSKEHDISINNEMRTSYEGRAFIYTGNLELKCQSCRTKEVRQMFIEKFGDEYDPDYMGTETV